MLSKRLRIAIAAGNFEDLPSSSVGHHSAAIKRYERVASAGFEAVQGGNVALACAAGMAILGVGVVPEPAAADELARVWKQRGAVAISCIAGFGYEDDGQIDDLVRSLLNASERHSIPFYLETHRGSITQDVWRTLQLIRRTPQIQFTGDFSHWYTGQEIPYGDIHKRIELLSPVIERTALLHGRIGDRCCMQVDLQRATNAFVSFFEPIWTQVFMNFFRNADREEFWFCSELLGPEYDYARTFFDSSTGLLREETDRFAEACKLVDMAKSCFANAQETVAMA